ncbi:MAG: glycosyltransferase family 2 protein [Patescibacteria group bacterium]
MKLLDLSIVICNYNTQEILQNTLSSIYKFTRNINFEIIVVDDGSTDNSVGMVKKYFPYVRIIKNYMNLGYSKSANKGTKISRGRYVLHLNSDVVFTKKTSLEKILEFMNKSPHIGISGCKIITNNGDLDLPCRHSIPSLLNSFFQMFSMYRLFPKIKSTNYYMTYFPVNQITKVGGLGAFMIIRKDVIRKIGYLDERFFIYCEDTDYCIRTIKAGWDIYYYPKIAVKHMQGGTTNQLKMKSLLLFHKSILLYYKKHFSQKNFFLLNLIVYAGIYIRLILYIIVKFFSNKIKVSTTLC